MKQSPYKQETAAVKIKMIRPRAPPSLLLSENLFAAVKADGRAGYPDSSKSLPLANTFFNTWAA